MRPSEVLRHYRTAGVRRVVAGGVLWRPATSGIEVLVLQRNNDEEYGGIDELPSGEVEADETVAAALVREICEETAIGVVAIGEFVFDFVYESRKGRTVQLNFAVAVGPHVGVTTDPAEHQSHRWLPGSRLGESRLTPNILFGLGAWMANH